MSNFRAPSSRVQRSPDSGFMISISWPGLFDLAGGHFARAFLLHAVACRLGPSTCPCCRPIILDVQDDVGDVLAHAGDRREFVQHAIDLDRRSPPRPAAKTAESRRKRIAQASVQSRVPAALQPPGGDTARLHRSPGWMSNLFGLISSVPILLQHVCDPRQLIEMRCQPTRRLRSASGKSALTLSLTFLRPALQPGRSGTPSARKRKGGHYPRTRPGAVCAAGIRCGGSV